MATFFDRYFEGQMRDLEELKNFIGQHTPDQVSVEARSSSLPPEDLLMVADMVRMFVKQDGTLKRAKVLYAEGMRKILAGPPGVLSDNDMLSNMRNWCLCCLPDELEEACRVVAQEPQVVAADPALATMLTALLVENGLYRQAQAVLSGIEQIPLEDLLPKLEAAEMNFDTIRSLKDAVRTNLGKRKMRDLIWWYDESAVKQLPERLIEMDLDELTKYGIAPDVLGTLRTAVVFRASDDRKMWFCGFFDVKDPSPLIDSGRTGRFQATFYNRTNLDRMGRWVGDGNVTVYAVN